MGWEDGYSEILIEPAPNSTTGNLISELKNALDNGKYRVSEVVNEAQIAADARQKSMPFFLISFFSLTMSIFIIYSSYKVITLDRLPIRAYSASGAGKSTLLYILGGLDVPTSGSVFMNGMDISKSATCGNRPRTNWKSRNPVCRRTDGKPR